MVRSLAVLLALLGVTGLLMGDDAKKPVQKEIELKSTIASDGKTCSCRACTINFSKELGVPLEYLSGLGHRIHQARRAPDPVELALAAQSLAVAEKVAGKKASLSADDVLAEAVTLGKQRGVSVELTALASIVQDAKVQQELAKELASAKTREQEEKSAVQSGERTKGLDGDLYVINHSHECIRIFVNGFYQGTIHEGQTSRVHVHDHYNHHTELTAICEGDGQIVSKACVEGHQHRYVWHIH